MVKDIDEILNSQDKKIIEIYMELQDYYEQKFGKDVIILYELGSFYEIYQYDNKGKAIEVSQLLNILLTKKNKKIERVDASNPNMCGLPSIKLEKYLDIFLREEKYTIIIVSQVGQAPNIKRKIDRIISPGTNLDFSNKNKSNYISSILLEKAKDDIIIGSSSYIDLSSGNVFNYEIYGTSDDKELALDELYKLSNTYYGKEVLLTLDGFEDSEKDSLISKLNLNDKSYIIQNIDFYKKSININYQNKLLQSIYNLKSILSPIEHFNMDKHLNVSTSLVILLEFIIEHNNTIVNNLKEPILLNNEQYLVLGNNASEQLEVLSSGNNKGLIDILTKGCSTYGKRFINQRLLNPILDKNEINRRYNNSFAFTKVNNIENIQIHLNKIYDLERLFRKSLIKNIHPFELSNFYSSLNSFLKAYKLIINDDNINGLDFILNIDIKELIAFYKDFKETFDMDLLQLYSLNSIDTSFIKEGVSKELDDYQIEYKLLYKEIENLANDFVKLIDSSKEYNSLETIVKINNNETEGYFFTITKKRYDFIKPNLININSILNHQEVNLKNDFSYKTLTGSVKITSDKLKEVSDKLIDLYNNILKETMIIYNVFVDNIQIYKNVLDNLIIALGELEFSILNADLYKYNAYSIPETLDLDESFYEVIELRHPIIEKLEEKGLYVPNNIVLGNKKHISKENSFEDFYKEKNTNDIKGIMLYGINSSGKCLDPYDRVMMYNNSIKYVKDIVVGDKIMGDDGTKRNVLNTTNGNDFMYKITFKNGDTFKCNGNHILCLKSCNYKAILFDKTTNRYRVVWYEGFSKKSKTFMCNNGKDKSIVYNNAKMFLETLEEDYNEYTISINDFLKLDSGIKRNFIMYKNKLNYKHNNVFVDPYLLGYWLGDGTSSSSNITTTNQEVVDYINCLENYDVKQQKSNKIVYNVCEKNKLIKNIGICPICEKEHTNSVYCSRKCVYDGICTEKNNFMKKLKKLNLINNKHIPKSYMFNSEEIRLGILAGLLDSDGHLSKNGMYEITQKNEVLSNDIERLARSLGLYVNKRKVKKRCCNNDVWGIYYRISIGGELLKKLPLKIEYKKIKEITTDVNTLRNMYSFKIESIGLGNYSGFELDGNHKFLLHDFTVTHNSSLTKSVGLSVMLAQAGMFVPAKSLRYTIYDSIFTRISGKDDLYRGLSSFAVEMLELKNIFNRVNKKSLVLGDEISHGTETISGMSIVASTVINLIKNNFNFMFATHLHQLNDLDEVKSLNKMINLHLAVKYDEKEDKLIYNRKLAYGSGSSVYGLEFAKYLKLDKEFLRVANDIRMKIAEDLTDIEFISKKKTSSYNKNVYFTKCAFCNNKANEIHHIKEQQNALNGIVDSHRLNHEFNLVPLCKKHHDIVHKYQDSNQAPLLKYIQTSNGIELEINEILKDKL